MMVVICSNEDILISANTRRKTMCRTGKRQAEFIGHVSKKIKLEHLVTKGKIKWKRCIGRQIIKIFDCLTA